jgi:hypothetical protein
MLVPNRPFRAKMRGVNVISRLAVNLAGAGALIAAAPPSVLSQAEGGLWEVDRSGAQPVRLCVPNPATLAQFEHRNGRCTRSVIREAGTDATIHYSCAGGGFGQSKLTVITPRSLRIETQGISGNSPFKYVLQARRVGNCAGH